MFALACGEQLLSHGAFPLLYLRERERDIGEQGERGGVREERGTRRGEVMRE